VCDGRDARRAVDRQPHVALARLQGLARVDPHPHADRSPGQALLRLDGGLDGPAGRREPDEERIALGVDLHASVPLEGVAKHGTVLGQRGGVSLLAELVEQSRRALDIGEQKRDDPAGQRFHGASLPLSGGEGNRRYGSFTYA
jgi:hypothetical protein